MYGTLSQAAHVDQFVAEQTTVHLLCVYGPCSHWTE